MVSLLFAQTDLLASTALCDLEIRLGLACLLLIIHSTKIITSHSFYSAYTFIHTVNAGGPTKPTSLANPLTKGVQHPYNPPCGATVPKVFKG